MTHKTSLLTASGKPDRRLGPRVTYSQSPLGYTDDSLQHYLKSQYIKKFLSRKGTASPTSAKTYATHLKSFAFYIYKVHPSVEVDAFIDEIRTGKQDPYDILADFAKFLRESRTEKHKLGANHVVQMVKSAKRCMRMNGVAVINEDFREFVSLPRKVRKVKSPIDKLTVSKLLNSSKDVQLSSFIMFNAVLGPRPIEAAAVRNSDLDLDSQVPKVTFRAEYTKTRVERTRYLTAELVAQLKLWMKYNYRKHRTMGQDGVMLTVTPTLKPDDLVFAHWPKEWNPLIFAIVDFVKHEEEEGHKEEPNMWHYTEDYLAEQLDKSGLLRRSPYKEIIVQMSDPNTDVFLCLQIAMFLAGTSDMVA